MEEVKITPGPGKYRYEEIIGNKSINSKIYNSTKYSMGKWIPNGISFISENHQKVILN